jgi:tripartite-type tricarboxylate transporter receptor subunit TctC
MSVTARIYMISTTAKHRPSALAPLFTVALVAVACAACACAADYPTKPVRFIVPLSPGGPADSVARLVATPLAARLHQPVVVDNRSGASTLVGTEIVARSPADGYTMLMITTTHAINPSVFRNLPYDLLADLTPVTMTASAPFVIVVQPRVAVSSVKDLIAMAQRKPDALSYGTSGVGSSMHLTTELFANAAQISMTHVPYKGAGPAFVDLLGAHIDIVFSSALAALPHVNSGKLRGIAVTSLKRISVMRALPTVAESGFPGFESSSWNGVMVPAKTPARITAQLQGEIAAALAVPAVAESLSKEGANVGGNSSAEFGAYIKSEMQKWAAVIKRIGIKPE